MRTVALRRAGRQFAGPLVRGRDARGCPASGGSPVRWEARTEARSVRLRRGREVVRGVGWLRWALRRPSWGVATWHGRGGVLCGFGAGGRSCVVLAGFGGPASAVLAVRRVAWTSVIWLAGWRSRSGTKVGGLGRALGVVFPFGNESRRAEPSPRSCVPVRERKSEGWAEPSELCSPGCGCPVFCGSPGGQEGSLIGRKLLP